MIYKYRIMTNNYISINITPISMFVICMKATVR